MSEELNNIFKPSALTIRQIFTDSSSYYQIPNYQRPYSWGDEEVEQLWDDLFSAMLDNTENYFLGPIILIGPQEGSYEVVDGQQRLTTLTILFCVLRDLYLKEDKKIENCIKSLEVEKFRLNFRLTNQPNTHNEFEQKILNGILFPNEELSKNLKKQNRFINSAVIFRAKLKEIEKDPAIIPRFVDYLLNKTIMISITCTKQSFAIKLFQVLNARGLDLNPADLIKSYLYSKCLTQSERDSFMSDWREVEKTTEQIEESVTDLLTYYQYYLLARNPKRALLEELEDEFKNKNSNAIVYELKEFTEAFLKVYGTETKELYSFWYLPNQVFWKSIVTVAKFKNYPDFNKLCGSLRRFFYAYWIAGYTTTKIKQFSFNLIGWVKANRSLAEINAELESKMLADSVPRKLWVSLEEDAYGESWLRPLLALIEYEQVDQSKPGYIDLDSQLHVDHILPSGWDHVKEWKESWSTAQADAYVNKIGNLTLLSGKKNITASNSSFKKKKEIYEKGHGGKVAFEISKQVIERDKWTESEVKERQIWMFQEIIKLLAIEKPAAVTLNTAEIPNKVDGNSFDSDGWTQDVLNCVKRLAKMEFDLTEFEIFETELKSLHPRNDHIQAKVRQQLQVLRDKGILRFLGKGRYRLENET